MPTTSSTVSASWEYLNRMPKIRKRMAGYIRESDPALANSTTIESAAKAIREYGERKGYIYPAHLEFKEAISAHDVPYYQRTRLMDMLKAGERHEFDVLVITEVRALSRRGAGEVFIIFNALEKEGIELETPSESFSADEMGELLLGFRAHYAKIERQTSYTRMQRGKADRITIGKAPNGHPKPAYGYILVDSERETRAIYQFNHTIIYVDNDGVSWSEYKVICLIFDMLKQGSSLRSIATYLNDLGIPPPHKPLKGKPLWAPSTIYRMVSNPIYYGEVWNHRFTKVGKTTVIRPRSEWIRLPDAPAVVDRQTWEAIQYQFSLNREESMRNNQHRGEGELGLLRSGYIFCGICGRRMQVCQPSPAYAKRGGTASYQCRQKAGTDHQVNHRTHIHLSVVDPYAKQKIREALLNHDLIVAKIWEIREKNKPRIDEEAIRATIASLQEEMDNLIELAQHAKDKKTIDRLGLVLQDLETQQREAELSLYDLDADTEERRVIEEEITLFEQWVAQTAPHLTDPNYLETASYKELRLAVRVLGLKATVYPTKGDYPFRCDVRVTVPKIMEKLKCSGAIDPLIPFPVHDASCVCIYCNW